MVAWGPGEEPDLVAVGIDCDEFAKPFGIGSWRRGGGGTEPDVAVTVFPLDEEALPEALRAVPDSKADEA